MTAPRVYVKLPGGLLTADGQRGIFCRARNVEDALRRLVEREPHVSEIVFSGSSQLRVTVILNGLDVVYQSGLTTALQDGDAISLLAHCHGRPSHRLLDASESERRRWPDSLGKTSPR